MARVDDATQVEIALDPMAYVMSKAMQVLAQSLTSGLRVDEDIVRVEMARVFEALPFRGPRLRPRARIMAGHVKVDTKYHVFREGGDIVGRVPDVVAVTCGKAGVGLSIERQIDGGYFVRIVSWPGEVVR